MKTGQILVADDDASIRMVLDAALSRDGHKVKTAANAATLWQWIDEGEGDVVISDVVMPDENGLDLLPRIKARRPDLPVIVMSAQNTILTAIKATEKGAYEYLPKPFDLQELSQVIQRALAGTVSKPPKPKVIEDAEETLPLVGRSPSMQEIYRVLARLMPTDLTVMVNGESGTGKELVAQALHDYGKRKDGPFVAVNMAAIPRDLIESELFGHEKGAFTGAVARNPGRFSQARGGTLFLDEIGDMPPEAQTRLLRVLQQGEYTTVGGREPIKADVRIVAATHRDLRDMIARGQFREDLYYRLNVVPIKLPPLRDRMDDVPDLVRHFMRHIAEREGLSPKTLSSDAMKALRSWSWPGNVRELENLCQRLAALYVEDMISEDVVRAELSVAGEISPAIDTGMGGTVAPSAPVGDDDEGGIRASSLGESVFLHLERYFQAHDGELPPPGLYQRVLQEVERPLLQLVLKAVRGNQVRASDLLGINRNTLRKKMRELDVSWQKTP